MSAVRFSPIKEKQGENMKKLIALLTGFLIAAPALAQDAEIPAKPKLNLNPAIGTEDDFMRFDKNNSGSLDPGEYSAMKLAGVTPFKEIDTNSNGSISSAELSGSRGTGPEGMFDSMMGGGTER